MEEFDEDFEDLLAESQPFPVEDGFKSPLLSPVKSVTMDNAEPFALQVNVTTTRSTEVEMGNNENEDPKGASQIKDQQQVNIQAEEAEVEEEEEVELAQRYSTQIAMKYIEYEQEEPPTVVRGRKLGKMKPKVSKFVVESSSDDEDQDQDLKQQQKQTTPENLIKGATPGQEDESHIEKSEMASIVSSLNQGQTAEKDALQEPDDVNVNDDADQPVKMTKKALDNMFDDLPGGSDDSNSESSDNSDAESDDCQEEQTQVERDKSMRKRISKAEKVAMEMETDRLIRTQRMALKPIGQRKDMSTFLSRFITAKVDNTANYTGSTIQTAVSVEDSQLAIDDPAKAKFKEIPPPVIKKSFETYYAELSDDSDMDLEIVSTETKPLNPIEQLRESRLHAATKDDSAKKSMGSLLSRQELRMEKIKLARIEEAKRRHANQPAPPQLAPPVANEAVSDLNNVADECRDTEETKSQPLRSHADEDDEVEEESEAEMTENEDSGSSEDETCKEDREEATVAIDVRQEETETEREALENEEEEDEELLVIKPTRKCAILVVEKEDGATWELDQFEPTAVQQPVANGGLNDSSSKSMLMKMLMKMKESGDEDDGEDGHSQIPEPSFALTDASLQASLSGKRSLEVSMPNIEVDDDDEEGEGGGFRSLHIKARNDDDFYDNESSIDETMTERSITPASHCILSESQQEFLLQESTKILAPYREDLDNSEGQSDDEMDKELALVDGLRAKKPRRLLRAVELIDDSEQLQQKKPARNALDEVIKKPNAFVENEAEVEEDEFMDAGGQDGENIDIEEIRQELAQFIEEDEEILAKMTVEDLQNLLKQDDNVREFHNQLMRDRELKETKVLVRDIATGKILDKRKHGGDVSRKDLDKFGRAADEEEDENALKELDNADYGLFGDIISKYVSLRKESAAKNNQLKKRKRQDGLGSDDENSTGQKQSLAFGEEEDFDWTNESTIGAVQILPGHSIETDLDKLGEKMKKQTVVSKMQEIDRSVSTETQIKTFSYAPATFSSTRKLAIVQDKSPQKSKIPRFASLRAPAVSLAKQQSRKNENNPSEINDLRAQAIRTALKAPAGEAGKEMNKGRGKVEICDNTKLTSRKQTKFSYQQKAAAQPLPVTNNRNQTRSVKSSGSTLFQKLKASTISTTK